MKRTLRDVERILGADTLQLRQTAADREAEILDQVLIRVKAGLSRSDALRELLPGCMLESQLRRLRDYEAGGRDVLVSRRYGPPAPLKMTPEVKGGLRVLAISDPNAGSEVLAQRLSAMFDISVSMTLVQNTLKELGLARPPGRRWPLGTTVPEAEIPMVEPLALAGAELLKAVEEEIGAVAAMTMAMGEWLDSLPPPDGPVEDDRGDRDEHGRFLKSYNRPEARTEPELGARFNSVVDQRVNKDLTSMRVVEESFDTRHRKNLAMVLMPCVVRSARWSELEHWRGSQLEGLVGYAYQPETLDKYLRELKFAGCAETMRESVASCWLGQEGMAIDQATGAVVVYMDGTTKPLWTHHWTRSTKVSKTGRIQPAVTTMSLHSGAGTPLVYRSYSGNASLPGEISGFLAEYERYAGVSTARRVVVMDRESHCVALFKSLSPTWDFVVPLRSHVTGPTAKFEEMERWGPYGEGPDEVCNGWLWLKDSRPDEAALRIRVVGRRRHRTGKVAWYGTLLPVEDFTASDVIRLYFERWPAQEHVYRDGSGAVGLKVHHGYGKMKVDNLAVIDGEEKLLGQLHRLETNLAKHKEHLAKLEQEQTTYQNVLATDEPEIRRKRRAFDEAIALGRLVAGHQELREREGWIEDTRTKLNRLVSEMMKVQQRVTKEEAAQERKLVEVAHLSAQRRIFTVDVELDEIVMGFKLTFMNLCNVLMTKYLVAEMEMETLIDSVLTLPGERLTNKSVETIRIYRQPRDPRAMAAVDRACVALTARGLRRGDRQLVFELADPPDRRRRLDPNELR